MHPVAQYLAEVGQVVANLPQDQIKQVIEVLLDAWRHQKRVFVLGNGGSAATASHFTNDLNKGSLVPGKGRFRAIALTDNVPLITAWANDTAYENIFAEQLLNFAAPGDIVIGISTSGNSANVLRAVEVARVAGAITVAWTGKSGGRLKDLVDYCIHVPTDCTEQVEDAHMVLDHVIATTLRHLIADS